MKFSMAVLLTLLGTASVAAQGMPPGYLNEMPDPARVLASFGDSDSLDRTARQKAAFTVLRQLIEELSDGRAYRNQLTADEERVYKNYADARALVPTPHFDDAESRRLGWASPSGKWTVLQQDLMLDGAFRNELLDRFFPPAWKSNYLAVVAAKKKRVAALNADIKRRTAGGGQEGAPAAASRAPAQAGGNPAGEWFGFGAIALLLLALGLARELRPFGLDDSDPFTIRSGWRSYKVYSSTGTVLSPTKSRVVTTHVSGGGDNQPVSTSTSTSIFDQFFIRESNGFERAMQLTNVNVALREGHQFSAVWAIRKGQKSGPFFLFRNHSTRHVDFVDSVLNTMLRPHIWPVLPLIFTALVVVAGSVHMCLSCLFNIMSADNTAGSSLGLLTAVVAVPVGFFIVWAIITGLRARRLKRQMADKLQPILDRRATEQIATPSGGRVTPG